jgi:cell wall-associated NlpC family hydrolase
MPTSAQFVETARRFRDMRVPFQHQGRTLRGVDCWGLVVLTCRTLGIPVADDHTYGPRPSEELVAETMAKTATRKPGGEIRPGNLLLLEIGGKKIHIAIAAEFQGRTTMIHTSQLARRVTERGLGGFPVVAVYAIPGVD